MSLDAALEDLQRARPGWGWSVRDYQHGHATAFLHYPDGQGCVHADAETAAEAVHAVIALTDENSQEERAAQLRREREESERAELARLRAKYPDHDGPDKAEGS